MSRQPHQHTVLVTGNNGFTGRHLVDHLHSQDRPIRIVGFDLHESADARVEQQLVGDLSDVEAITSALTAARPDTIIHLAGRMPPATDTEMWATNVGGTFNLLEVVRSTKIRPRVLVIGSAAEYGSTDARSMNEDHPCSPVTVYGRTKFAQTLLCQQCCARFGLPIVIARPFNLFGPDMSSETVIGEICSQVAQQPTDRVIRLGNLASARDFLDVRDAVAAYWRISRQGSPGEIYNVCSGQTTTIRALVDTLIGVTGNDYTVESRPERLRERDVPQSCGDHAKLTRLTGWQPSVSLADGLRDTLVSFHAPRAQAVDAS
jgi:GDP-4-dehydro-6-deoxy-D-mannose reductase